MISRHTPYRLWGLVVVILICTLLITVSRQIIVKGLVNAGQLGYIRAMASADVSLPQRRYRWVKSQDDLNLNVAQKLLGAALRLDANDFAARWSFGRTAMALAEYLLAAQSLAPLEVDSDDMHFALAHMDLLNAYAQADDYSSAIAFYERERQVIHPTRWVSDTIALAYLEESLTTEDNGRLLEAAWALRPMDLYVNYHLWQESQRLGDESGSSEHLRRLREFPLEAIDPTDDRLVSFLVQAIPEMLASKGWNHPMAMKVLSYLVWQHYHLPDVAQLAQMMATDYPDEPEWLFYLAEYHHRRGELDTALMYYTQVTQKHPNYSEAYLRLGMLNETMAQGQSDDTSGQAVLAVATEWYQNYLRLAPDDYVGRRSLERVTAQLNQSDTPNFASEMEIEADGRHLAAQMLGVSTDSLVIGQNLVSNGSFSEWGEEYPAGWRFQSNLGPSRDQGLLYGARTALGTQDESATVVGLWGSRMPNGEYTYAEYVGAGGEFVIDDSAYLVFLSYRAWDFSVGSALFVLGDVQSSEGPAFVQEPLVASDGRWQVAQFLFEGPAKPIPVMPLVRISGVGNLEIGTVEVRPVLYQTP